MTEPSARQLSLLSSHGLVLLYLARKPEALMVELAEAVGMTERGALSVIDDLVAEGYVRRLRQGRRNIYEVDLHKQMPQGMHQGRQVKDLFTLMIRGHRPRAPKQHPKN